MDPFSITVSIATAIHLTSKVILLLSDAKGATAELERCTLELSHLTGLLISLRFRLEGGQHDEPWYTSVKALNTNDGFLKQYIDTLSELQERLSTKSGIAKLGQALVWKFKKEEIESLLSRIERWKSLVQIALELDHFRLSQALNDSIQEVYVRTQAINDATDKLLKTEERKKNESITEWISSLNYPAQQADIISTKQKDTGNWFLKSPEFQTWQQEPRQTLFCPGIPGAGKTMIAAITVDHLSTALQSPDIGIAYIYCNYRAQAEQTVAGFHAAILKELVQSRPSGGSRPLEELYDRHTEQKTRPSVNEILKTLQLVLANFRNVFIVVDALDECPTQDRTRTRLVATLRELQANADVRLMFTSRFITDIENLFFGVPKLEVRATEDDVRRFVAGRLDHLPKCVQRNNSLQHEVEEKVAKSVDGMFLLARLFVDSLQDKNTPRAVRQAIEHFSPGTKDLERLYDKAYGEALHRIDKQLPGDQELAKKLLAWITYAKRQLSVTEICHALAVVPGDEDLDLENICDIEDAVSLCAGLVIVDEESGIIRLVHYTTQVYFEQVREQWLPTARVDLASTCLSYLSFSGFRSGSRQDEEEYDLRLALYPFLRYVAIYWGEHCFEVQEEIKQQVRNLLLDHGLVSSMIQAMWLSGEDAPMYSFSDRHEFAVDEAPLHVLSLFGLHIIAQGFYANGACFGGQSLSEVLELEDIEGSTPLMVAVARGHYGMAEWLVAAGADVNASQCYFDDMNPQFSEHASALHAASWNGYHEIVELLLDNGATIDISIAGSFSGTPLYTACSEGHLKTVQLLLKRGADIDISGYLGTALSVAVEKGHEEIVRLLLDASADPNKGGGVCASQAWDNGYMHEYEGAVRTATAAGRTVTLKLLLDAGGDEATALQATSHTTHVEVVRDLLDTGSNIDARDGRCDRALETAVKMLSVSKKDLKDRMQIVRLLLSKGANPDYGNVLHKASYHGHTKLLHLLLEKGADVNAVDEQPWGARLTALHLACMRGHSGVVRTLLEKGASIGENGPNHNILRYASKGTDTEVVRLLLDRGVDINAKDAWLGTALQEASLHGRENIVELLLSRGANVDAGGPGETALQMALRSGHMQIVQLLRDHGAKVHTEASSSHHPREH